MNLFRPDRLKNDLNKTDGAGFYTNSAQPDFCSGRMIRRMETCIRQKTSLVPDMEKFIGWNRTENFPIEGRVGKMKAPESGRSSESFVFSINFVLYIRIYI